MRICVDLVNLLFRQYLEGKADELVLVNCCDSMRRVYDIVAKYREMQILIHAGSSA